METIINAPRRFKLYAAAMAMAALVITLLAVVYATGPAQAQNADNTYSDPQPCGPEAGDASMDEPHEITTGHYALFDAYWEWTKHSPNEGIMHTNECPPKMVLGRAGWSRTTSNIDTKEAIIHVENTRQATVVDSDAEGYDPDVVDGLTIDVQEYTELEGVVEVGKKVWWLRLDDLDTKDTDEASDLSVGFSTALFDSKYWLERDEDGGAPMRYMLETARYREGEHAESPHFFAYEAPKIRRDESERRKPVLDSTELDVEKHSMEMVPGEYRALEWIFTEEGSYTLSAHLQGFVRHRNPKNEGDQGYDPNWEAISSKGDETSEITRYVFQVGDNLDETEPPMFGVSMSVHETAASGTHVGGPVQVFGAEVPELSYSLSGDGSDNFTVIARTHPDAAQIVLANGDMLDYSIEDSYDLVLEVTDNKDHEGNIDPSIDHSVAVEIAVIQDPRVYALVNRHTPRVRQNVKFRVNVWGLPNGITADDLSYTLRETSSSGAGSFMYLVPDAGSYEGTATISKDAAGTYKYVPEATYTQDGVTYTLHGDPVTITWRNRNP